MCDKIAMADGDELGGDECVDLPAPVTSPPRNLHERSLELVDQTCGTSLRRYLMQTKKTGVYLPPTKKNAFHGGTTNLREHLSSKHPLQYKAETQKQTTLYDYTKRSWVR